MTTGKLKTTTGWIFLASHFLFIPCVFILKGLSFYDDAAFRISLVALMPLLAHYITRVISDFNLNKHNTGTGKIVSRNYALSCIIFPCLFVSLIAFLLAKQAIRPDLPETFACYLGLSETFFGIYVAMALRGLFNE